MSKGSRNRSNRAAFAKNWPLGPAKGGVGLFVVEGDELVPAGTATRVSKHDSRHIKSIAAGVLPDDVPRARREVAAAGLDGVKYTPAGDVVFKNRGSKLKFMKHAGLHDKDEVRG